MLPLRLRSFVAQVLRQPLHHYILRMSLAEEQSEKDAEVLEKERKSCFLTLESLQAYGLELGWRSSSEIHSGPNLLWSSREYSTPWDRWSLIGA